ncbi:MAG: hypothetical protein ACFCUE_14810 [Candidatus Bathyarchaeia archaeon]|jgi:hypothetical protein
MTLKALYVPPQAIQGEDVPAHILWTPSSDFCTLLVSIPSSLQLKEIYNVLDASIERTKSGEIRINKFEMDGYAGFLFSTHNLPEYSKKEKITFRFSNSNGKKTVEEMKEIVLFRPQLELGKEPPKLLLIDPERAITSEKIRLKKLGQGTLIINFKTCENSEIQKKVPDGVSEYLVSVGKDLNINVKEIIEIFPEQKENIENYCRFLIKPWKSYDELKEVKNIAIQIGKAVMNNEKFSEAFTQALGKAFLKNIKLLTLPESLLKYLDSVLAHKVWLVEPWQVIPVTKEAKKLIIEILPTNLLLNDYASIRLPEIMIQGKSEGFIEIARLFEWK